MVESYALLSPLVPDDGIETDITAKKRFLRKSERAMVCPGKANNKIVV
jgi:hypothetical protein